MPVAKKLVALTFDAGSNADGVPSILSTLAAKDAPGTFFLTGRFVRTFRKSARHIAKQHLVGNHTRTHPDLTTLPDDRIIAQVRTAQRAIIHVTGEDPRRFFRFPFGARTGHEIAVVNQLCYVPFRWTVDTLGWKGTKGGQSVESVIARVMAAAAPGAIVLMHVGSHPKDGTTLDAAALPRIIRKLRHAGYRLVPLSRVMSPDP
jgi:peptidoglycan/xylan/chitin deacetylase (PgdA/CDA1 family)